MVIKEESKKNPEIKKMWNEAKNGKVSVSFVHKVATKQPVPHLKVGETMCEKANRKLREANKKLKKENKELKTEIKTLKTEKWELQKKLYTIINENEKSNEKNYKVNESRDLSIKNVREKLKNNKIFSISEGKSLYYENPLGKD